MYLCPEIRMWDHPRAFFLELASRLLARVVCPAKVHFLFVELLYKGVLGLSPFRYGLRRVHRFLLS